MKKKFNLSEWLPESELNSPYQDSAKDESHSSASPLPGTETIEKAVQALEASGVDVTAGYDTWRNICFAFVEECGEGGRDYFHRVSRFNPQYNQKECDRQYTSCLKANGSGITIGTFYHYLKAAGIKINNPEKESFRTSPSVLGKDPLPNPSVHNHNNTSDPEFSDVPPEDDEEEEEMPLFPDSIFPNLPIFLQKVVAPAKSKEERDILLLGSLATLSACFPKLFGIYDDKKIWPNLYLFVTAPASAGKGRLSLCKLLVLPIHKAMREQAKDLKLQYANELAEYNMDKNGSKGKPGKPPERMLFIPANNSATGVFQLLSDNKGKGLIFENEGDTLTGSWKSDHGNFSDGFRNAWGHETISYYRRTDREYVDIEYPRLSAVLSGTPKQVTSLVPSAENGLFSRLLFYCMNLKLEWKKVFARTSSEGIDGYYLKLGDEFYDLYKTLNQNQEIEITLTEDQAEIFDKYFSQTQTKFFNIENPEFIASIRRMGVSAFRMIMLFSALRIMEDGVVNQVRECEDDDFQSVMAMVEVLIKHSSKVFSTLPEEIKAPKRKNKKARFLEALPYEFDRQTYLKLAAVEQIAPKAAEKYVTQFVKSGLIHKEGHNQYHNPAKKEL